MAIDFMTIEIVLVDEQEFVWVFSKLPLSASASATQAKRFRCWEMIDV